MEPLAWRKIKSQGFVLFWMILGFIALIPVLSLVIVVVVRGLFALFFDGFSAQNPYYAQALLYSFLGTIIVAILTMLVASPITLFSALYLSEWLSGKRLAFLMTWLRAYSDMPALLTGMVIVLGFPNTNSTWVTLLYLAATLTAIGLPRFIRTTYDVFRTTSPILREGALAIGATKSQMIFKVLLPSHRAQVLAVYLQQLARVIGETASLLLFVKGGQAIFLSVAIDHAVVNASYDALTRAYGFAFLLLLLILMILWLARRITNAANRML